MSDPVASLAACPETPTTAEPVSATSKPIFPVASTATEHPINAPQTSSPDAQANPEDASKQGTLKTQSTASTPAPADKGREPPTNQGSSLDGEVVEVDGEKLEWIRDGGEESDETGDELPGEGASVELAESDEVEVDDDGQKEVDEPRRVKKKTDRTRKQQHVQSKRKKMRTLTHAEVENTELSEDVETDAAKATGKQQEDYPGEALATGIGGVGLLLLCMAPFFSWANFGNEGLIGLEGDGKIVLAVSVIALGVFVAATVKENLVPGNLTTRAKRRPP